MTRENKRTCGPWALTMRTQEPCRPRVLAVQPLGRLALDRNLTRQDRTKFEGAFKARRLELRITGARSSRTAMFSSRTLGGLLLSVSLSCVSQTTARLPLFCSCCFFSGGSYHSPRQCSDKLHQYASRQLTIDNFDRERCRRDDASHGHFSIAR